MIGEAALSEVVKRDDVDLVLVAVVGITGLLPTLEAIRAGKELALANKETLVAGGALVLEEAKKHHTLIRPVDSEHSAIFQSMIGQDQKGIHKILLTASGGPFRGRTKEELAQVTVADAMKHPTWNMGMKVTLDSATMFNKGLEVIEAHWLFGVDYQDIEVIVQPQSLIHSMVEYVDGTIMAQIGLPDMRLPIQFALTYPDRLPSPSHAFVDWSEIAQILIAKPDLKVFRSLKLAYEAGEMGETAVSLSMHPMKKPFAPSLPARFPSFPSLMWWKIPSRTGAQSLSFPMKAYSHRTARRARWRMHSFRGNAYDFIDTGSDLCLCRRCHRP